MMIYNVIFQIFSLISVILADICSPRHNDCHKSAACVEKNGSYTCMCNAGFQGDGLRDCYQKYMKIGCFGDNILSRAINDGTIIGYKTFDTNTIQLCYERAKGLGYEYFGVELSTFCFTSRNAGKTYNKYGPKNNCKNGRGGWASLDVYKILPHHSVCFEIGNKEICTCDVGRYKDQKTKTCNPIKHAFMSQISMNETFTKTLEDKESREFYTLAKKVQNILLTTLQSSIPFIADIIVTKFTNESITAHFIIVIDDDKPMAENITKSQVQSTLKSSYTSGNLSKLLVIPPTPNIQLFNKCESYGCCLQDTLGLCSYKGMYRFNKTLVTQSVVTKCQYNKNGRTFRRSCNLDKLTDAAVWSNVDLGNCLPKSKTTRDLENLNMTARCIFSSKECQKRVDTARILNKIVANSSVITTPKDIAFIADIISIIVNNSLDQGKAEYVNVTENILETIGTIMETNRTIIAIAEHDENSATSLLKTIDSFTKRLGTTISNVGDNLTVSKKNIGVQVIKVNTTNDVKIYSTFDPLGQVFVGIRNYDTGRYSDFLASMSIPRSTFHTSDGLIYSKAYVQSTLFVQGENGSSRKNNIVQSIVLTVSLSNETKELKEPLILQFKKRSFQNNGSLCVFWNFTENNNKGGWSREGCRVKLDTTSDDIVTCECTHMTNFALLLDVYQTGSNPKSLQIVTWIGCVISLVGLTSTIFIFSFFSHLRGKLPSKILISLCLSLMILVIIFLVGIEQTKHRLVCQVIAALLHYFMMTSFTWMTVAAVNLYMFLVIVFRRGSDYQFFIKASLLAWGLPLIIVIVTGASNPNNLGNDRFCFPQGDSAHFGVLLPVLVVFVINISLFITIMGKLSYNKTPGDDTTERKYNLREVRIGLSVSVLLGLSWILAIFAVKDAEFIFQLLFCIFNSLQGFFIFVFYCLTSDQVKKQIMLIWRNKFGFGKKQNRISNYHSKSNYNL